MAPSRQLAAIMFTDIVGFSALFGKDEPTALRKLRQNKEIHTEILSRYNGNLSKEMGDGFLVSFNATSEAVYCAGAIQECAKEQDIELKISIHEGEVVYQDNDVFGDGVNIASRILDLVPSGLILVSGSVYRNIKNKPGIKTEFFKEAILKNIEAPVKVYQVEVGITEMTGYENIPDSSIAVLPFVNMSSDPEQEYFSDGISEEIINTLVQLPNLKVAGRTSAFSFKNKSEDLRIVGNILNVRTVLEGSVRKAGNQIRITTQLVDVKSGYHLWSKKFDRKLNDIFAIQDEIAHAIAENLQLALFGEPYKRKQTKSVEAYEFYLKGRALYYQRGPNLFEAKNCFQRALELDPGYALASSGLSDTYTMLIYWGYLPAPKTWPKAISMAQIAFEHGPDLAETHCSLAGISMFHDRNWKLAEENFKKALEVNPAYLQARSWYSLFYLCGIKKNHKEGIKQARLSIKNDPLSAYAHSVLAWVLLFSRSYQEGIKEAEHAQFLDPEGPLTHYTLGTGYHWSGNLEKAVQHFEKFAKQSARNGFSLYCLLLIYVKLDQVEKVWQIYKELENQYNNKTLLPSILAIATTAIGEKDNALKLLNEGCDIRDPWLAIMALCHKDADELRKLPRYNEILDRLGLNQVDSTADTK